MSRSRGWCFTKNNYSETDEHECFGLAWKVKYIVVGKEVGESGTPHLQGYIYYDTLKSFKQVQHDVPEGSHIEVAKGDAQQNFEYCSKEGDFFEEGERPLTQAEKGVKGKQAIEERWELAKAGKFEQLPPEQIKTYEYIYSKYKELPQDRSELDNIWIFGPSGCGKSRYVREHYAVHYSKGMNKWWDGYNGEDVVVLDDFDPGHGKFLGYFLKIWADHYAFNAEVKGGMLRIRPKKIIVTSQYPIGACFDEAETIEAVTRRFAVVDMNPVITIAN